MPNKMACSILIQIRIHLICVITPQTRNHSMLQDLHQANLYACPIRLRYDVYSYLSNKHSHTIILFGKIFRALRSYQRPYVYSFLKKLGKKKKKGYFQKFLYIAFQKFQALRQFQTPRLLGLDIFPRPYGYLQPYVYQRDYSPLPNCRSTTAIYFKLSEPPLRSYQVVLRLHVY